MAEVAPVETTMDSLIVKDDITDTEGMTSIESDSTVEVEVSNGRQPLVEKVSQPVTPESPIQGLDAKASPDLQMPVISNEPKNRDERPTSGTSPKPIRAEGSEVPKDPATEAKDMATSESTAKKETGRPRHSRPRRSRSKQYYDEDGSSSDDDSYFAKDLPSPKSGRSFSYDYSSAESAAAGSTNVFANSPGRESDASLSFSDESDEGLHHQEGVRISPMIPPLYTDAADMNLYPQRITRMHSVSSLVSSASSDGEREVPQPAPRSSVSSVSSRGTSATSDRSVRAEIRDFGVQGRPGSQMTDISGRRSPVVGHHGIPGYFYSSPSPVMSPPPIMQRYKAPPGVTHPEPQPISQEQLATWGFNQPPLYSHPSNPQQSYGSVSQAPDDFRPFEYNSPMFHNLSGGGDPHASGWVPKQAGQARGRASLTSQQEGRQYEERGRFNNSPQVMEGMGDKAAAIDALPRKSCAPGERGYKVYWQRWLMLMYMSVMNLLSDWTCYSVAPISMLTEEAFGNIDPERLVVVFLGANAIASVSEPVILSRLGLRRTVLFGALLLMIGSIIKSGGVPPVLKSDIIEGESAWRLYLGFFMVGLSQPLYQCTPTLLSSSWFPEEERTMATGVALNANQLGIGFAFVVGTLLVASKDDIIPYFGLLSSLSTIVFLGALIQFDDAPPTPPSASARVMRGTFDVKLPNINTIVESVRGFTPAYGGQTFGPSRSPPKGESSMRQRSSGSARRRSHASRSSATKESGTTTPFSSHSGSTASAIAEVARMKSEAGAVEAIPPSLAFVDRSDSKENQETQLEGEQHRLYHDPSMMTQQMSSMRGGYPGMGPDRPTPPGGFPPPYPFPYWDPRVQQQLMAQQSLPQQRPFYPPPYYMYQYQESGYPPPPHPYYFPHGAYPPPYLAGYDFSSATFPEGSEIDEGAEPILTITPHHLDIDIKDDQVIRSMKACFARQGFIHALVAFTASGIVINTLSTYMDYLVRLNGAPRAYTGIVGGAFQFIIMISSLIIGALTDKSRAYYSVTIGMLVLGAFALAECGVSLDSNNGNDLRWCLVVVAALVGPLQPVSTELGVDVVYPLSENTVLVIQQLFSNLLSALFIPLFKALKHVGSSKIDDAEMFERPEYTFSFYLLIVIHTAATVFFATFNGKYLRYEHELERKAEEEDEEECQEEDEEEEDESAMHPFFRNHPANEGERRPLV